MCGMLLRFAFQELSLAEVVATVDERNVASKKVLEKSGVNHAKVAGIFFVARGLSLFQTSCFY